MIDDDFSFWSGLALTRKFDIVGDFPFLGRLFMTHTYEIIILPSPVNECRPQTGKFIDNPFVSTMP